MADTANPSGGGSEVPPRHGQSVHGGHGGKTADRGRKCEQGRSSARSEEHHVFPIGSEVGRVSVQPVRGRSDGAQLSVGF